MSFVFCFIDTCFMLPLKKDNVVWREWFFKNVSDAQAITTSSCSHLESICIYIDTSDLPKQILLFTQNAYIRA